MLTLTRLLLQHPRPRPCSACGLGSFSARLQLHMPPVHAGCAVPSTADSADMQNATEDGEDIADEGADGLRFGPRPEALTVGGGPSARPSGALGAAGMHRSHNHLTAHFTQPHISSTLPGVIGAAGMHALPRTMGSCPLSAGAGAETSVAAGAI